MKIKYNKGTHLKVIGSEGDRKRGRVDKINTQFLEPFYTLVGPYNSGSVFWESELEIDEEYRDNHLNQLLDEV